MKALGNSILEVLLSLVLLSLLLCCIEASQLAGWKAIKTADYFAIAQQQLQSMAERLQSGCFVTEREMNDWNKENKALLPHGRGTLQTNSSFIKLSIFWGNKHIKHCLENQIGLSGCLQFIVGA